MAPGPVHATVTVAATVPTFAVAAWLTRDPGLAALAGAGCLCGTIVGPDLDHEWITANEQVFWRISPIVGIPYSLAWLPYSLIPHRSPLSHWPLVGTLGRVAYIVALLLLAQVHLRALGVAFDALWWTAHPKAALAFVAGLVVSDTLHFAFDGFPL